MKRKKVIREFKNAVDDPAVKLLGGEWKTYDRPQRGLLLIPLRRVYTLKELEAVLPCSATEIRHCTELSLVNKEAQSSTRKIGAKEIFKRVSNWRTAVRKVLKLTTGKSARQTRYKLVKTLVNWLSDEMVAHGWDPFLDEIVTISDAGKEAYPGVPKWFAWQVDGDWKAIIATTRPSGDPDSYPTVFGFYREWIGRWLPVCMPRPDFAMSAVLRARCELLRRAKRIQEQERTVEITDWVKH